VTKELRTLPGLRSVILSGGEAFLSRSFPYALARVASLGRAVYVITNGVKLPAGSREALLTAKPTVMVTIDSTSEDRNRQTRGPGVLARSLATLDTLFAMDLAVVVISVVTRANIAGLRHDFELLRARGVRNILLQQLHCEGRATANVYLALSPLPSQVQELYADLRAFEAHHSDMNIDYNEICFFPMRRTAYVKKCIPGVRYLPQRLFMCGAGFDFCALKTNGDVIPCNALRDCVMGNIFHEPLARILARSAEAENLRRLRELRVDSVPGCAACRYAPLCDGGCRADALNLTGNILAKHPYCGVRPGESDA
jgi:radical SAM protein with 4Fe4S-binding SPASM domain